jgi:acetyl esterase/lipase
MAPDSNPPARLEIDVEDVEYQQQNGKPMLARLYRPRGRGPFPAIVDVHGGAWVNGDRLNNAAIDEALARAGILVMAVDFRMPPNAPYPAALADVNLAIRWLKANAARLRARPDKIGGLGTSSGGQILMLAALRPRDPRYTALPLEGSFAQTAGIDARLSYIVCCWAVLSPVARYRMAQEKKIQRFLDAHLAFFGNDSTMAEADPQLALERGEVAVLPPALLIQGLADDNLDPVIADRFATAYKKVGGEAELHKFPGEPHMFITKDPKSANSLKALGLIEDFIRRRG